jgi:hypothetical protein
MKTRLSRCRASAGCKMRHSPVHKGERVTHVEQRVNYIIIKINSSIAAAANACALAAFQHQLIKIMLHRWLGLLEKCALCLHSSSSSPLWWVHSQSRRARSVAFYVF